MGYKAFNQEGKEVKIGDPITQYHRSELTAKFDGVVSGPGPQDNAKIYYIEEKESGPIRGESFAFTWNLTVIPEEDIPTVLKVMKQAHKNGILLNYSNFTYTFEGIAIDGMDPEEWLEALTEDTEGE